MSIAINPSKCVGCGRCIEVCPGNLIKLVSDEKAVHSRPEQNGEGTGQLRKAVIRREKDCWGCTSCLKECKTGAIAFFLGADIGGRGSVLSVSDKGDIRTWTVTAPDKSTKTIVVNRKESNKY